MTSDRLAMNLADRAMEYFSENKAMPLNLKALGAEFLEDDITFDVSIQKISEAKIEITVLNKTLKNNRKVSSDIYDIYKSKIVYEAVCDTENKMSISSHFSATAKNPARTRKIWMDSNMMSKFLMKDFRTWMTITAKSQ